MCVHVSLFTGLLSRSACGVEHPLTLSCTQRNDSAWYTTLGDEEDKTKGRGWGEQCVFGDAVSSKERERSRILKKKKKKREINKKK